ncbi:MAG: DnaJ domain-containing protein [Bradyrhizobiaceae bacterium]|nr:DnaJ domain-containing protein [Bradyrhizobiaceae bacterium]
MQNLYDLLGVRPDDDAETIKKAYRKAAKASHPDHHGGDPQAAARFRQISQAYEILSDPEQRADYDELLEFELRPLRHRLKRSFSDMKRHVGHGVTTGALLAIVLVVGYKMYDRVPKMPGHEAAGVMARQSTPPAADAAERERRERVAAPQMPLAPVAMPAAPAGAATAANDRDRPNETNAGPASKPVEQPVEVAGRHDEGDVPADAVTPANAEVETAVQHDLASLNAPSPAGEERNSVPATADNHDERAPEPPSANPGGVKPPGTKMPARARAMVATKRHTPSRRPIEQAALETPPHAPAVETSHTPTPDNAPARVFGVGF